MHIFNNFFKIPKIAFWGRGTGERITYIRKLPFFFLIRRIRSKKCRDFYNNPADPLISTDADPNPFGQKSTDLSNPGLNPLTAKRSQIDYQVIRLYKIHRITLNFFVKKLHSHFKVLMI